MKLLASLVATLSMAVSPLTMGQVAFPTKPIKIIVAYPAGQGTDIATRYLSDLASKELGQPFVIENRSGAGGNIGTLAAAQAVGNGYTLTMGTNATHVLNEFLYPATGFNAEKDFEPIALIGSFPMVIAVRSDSPLKSTADLLTVAKREKGSGDIAMPSTTARLVVELLKEQSKAPLFGVPYKGSGNAMSDLLGGHFQVIVDTPTALRPHLASGKVRAIGVTSSKPSGLVPGIPTVAEQGLQGFEVIAWNGLYAPKGTPAEVTATLNAAFNKVLSRPETRQRLLELGFEPVGGASSELRDFAASERSKWSALIKVAGIKLE